MNNIGIEIENLSCKFDTIHVKCLDLEQTLNIEKDALNVSNDLLFARLIKSSVYWTLDAVDDTKEGLNKRFAEL